MSTSESWEAYLTPQEISAYNQFFNAASRSKPGIVTGTEAVQFFATSGVPNQILSDIWETADRDNLGYLTRETFFVALKLIACAQHGKDVANNILATNVPLPQFEGVQLSSTNTTASDTPSGDKILPAEREKYLRIFQINQPGGGVMDGDKAKTIFLKSRLPAETLAQIWSLADVRQAGNLNQTEFVIAMHYIAKLMDGTLTKLPSTLPSSVYTSAGGAPPAAQLQSQPAPHPVSQRSQTIDSLGSLAFSSSSVSAKNQSQWNISPQEKAQYDSFFHKIDGGRTGYVQGSEAVEFFKNSRLPESELAQIWDIADSEQRGSLTRDEFAVAMHLIHKRLRGEPLTTSKPTIPPSPQVPPSSLRSTPTMQPALVQSPTATGASLLDDQDLLGDFGNNEQLTRETNEVNQLQNQMAALKTATSDTNARKLDAAQTLEQLAQQKQQLQAQLAQVKATHEAELAELKELQEKVESEKPSWLQAQQEHNAAQQQLLATQNEIAQLQQTLENGRAESERLRQAVRDIQEETARLNAELENLRAQVKQQNMMLDINRRQVIASEQDREQAQRDLSDFREERGLPESVLEEVDKTSSTKDTESAALQVSSPASSTNLFDIFSPKTSEAEKSKGKESNKENATDFDAIFGNFGSPVSSTEQSTSSPFDPAAWATPPERPSSAASGFQNTSMAPTTRSGRPAPPPPPPQSRHHRQTSEGQASVSSNTTKKQRAPPPPPPPTTTNTATTAAAAASPTDDISKESTDDFDAAFSESQLNEAKVVYSDIPGAANNNDLNWASSFGGFDFGNNDKPKDSTTAKDDDWDSIFGAPANKDSTPVVGFEDAFSSFGQQDMATTSETSDQKAKEEEKQQQNELKSIPSTGNSNLDELMKMGFEQKDAKDALERYDQDLTKASNFLLDKSSK